MKTISVAASDAAKHDLGLGRRDGDGLLPLAAGMHDASSDAMARARCAVRHLPIRVRVGLVHDRLLIVKVDAFLLVALQYTFPSTQIAMQFEVLCTLQCFKSTKSISGK
jgi:hypothetical protein